MTQHVPSRSSPRVGIGGCAHRRGAKAVAIAAALRPVEQVAAKERQGTRTDQHPGKLPEGSKGDARDKAAAFIGRSARSLDKAEAIVAAAEAEPEEKAAAKERMLSGGPYAKLAQGSKGAARDKVAAYTGRGHTSLANRTHVSDLPPHWRTLYELTKLPDDVLEAKFALPHGDFERTIESELPFKPSTAQRLMIVARDDRLSNAAHAQHLPPHWRTLYELTKLPDDVFEAKLADGTIHPEMQRKALEPEEKAAAKERQREHSATAPGKHSGQVGTSDGGRARDKVAAYTGRGHTSLANTAHGPLLPPLRRHPVAGEALGFADLLWCHRAGKSVTGRTGLPKAVR